MSFRGTKLHFITFPDSKRHFLTSPDFFPISLHFWFMHFCASWRSWAFHSILCIFYGTKSHKNPQGRVWRGNLFLSLILGFPQQIIYISFCFQSFLMQSNTWERRENMQPSHGGYFNEIWKYFPKIGSKQSNNMPKIKCFFTHLVILLVSVG